MYFIIKWATLSNTFNEEESFEPLAVQIWVAYFVRVTLLIPNPNLTLIDIINVTCPPSGIASLFFFFLSTLILKHLLCGNKISSFSFSKYLWHRYHQRLLAQTGRSFQIGYRSLHTGWVQSPKSSWSYQVPELGFLAQFYCRLVGFEGGTAAPASQNK